MGGETDGDSGVRHHKQPSTGVDPYIRIKRKAEAGAESGGRIGGVVAFPFREKDKKISYTRPDSRYCFDCHTCQLCFFSVSLHILAVTFLIVLIHVRKKKLKLL